MNTLMYEHPLTNEHLRVVKEVIGYTVVGPIGKTLACGDVGEYINESVNVEAADGLNSVVRFGCYDGMERHRADRCRPLQADATT